MNNTLIQTNNNQYFIKFGINAHCEAEEILGYPITQINENGAGILTLRTLLFVGLKYAGNPVTMMQAGDILEEIVNDCGMDYFSEKLGDAIQKSLNQQANQAFKQGRAKKKS